MSSTKSLLINSLIFCISCCFGVVGFEIFYNLVIQAEQVYSFENRYMLFKGSPDPKVFSNVDNFFLYQPNSVIESETYYYKNGWVSEYHYDFKTNNIGLVQDNYVKSKTPSILLLGDSFTEGQGSRPWFNFFKENFNNHTLQFVNGGILGTGFSQWKLLHDYLISQDINIKYLVVIFISNDFNRPVWNIKDHTIQCLTNYMNCVGNEDFYSLPPEKEKIYFLNRLKNYREENYGLNMGAKGILRTYFPGSIMVLRYLNSRYESLLRNIGIETNDNQKVINKLIDVYKDKILFIHLPQKDEILSHRLSATGISAKNNIVEKGAEVIDGYVECDLSIDDYLPNDVHPNSSGYSKISHCVTNSVKRKWHL